MYSLIASGSCKLLYFAKAVNRFFVLLIVYVLLLSFIISINRLSIKIWSSVVGGLESAGLWSIVAGLPDKPAENPAQNVG